MRNDIISSLALKRMCYIFLLRTWTEWWLNIRRHIKWYQVHNIWSKKKKRAGKKGEKHVLFSVPWEEPPRWGLWARHIWYSPTVDWETLHLFISKMRDLWRVNCFAREAKEGEWTYNCLIGQHLRTNGLFGTIIDVAASYVFSRIWPCNGY